MNRDRLPTDAASEVLRLESLLLKPDVRRDRGRMEELLAEDFVEFGASGRLWSREAIIAELGNESYAPPSVEDLSAGYFARGSAGHLSDCASKQPKEWQNR